MTSRAARKIIAMRNAARKRFLAETEHPSWHPNLGDEFEEWLRAHPDDPAAERLPPKPKPRGTFTTIEVSVQKRKSRKTAPMIEVVSPKR